MSARRGGEPDCRGPTRGVAAAILCFRLLNAALVATYFDPDEYWQAPEAAHRLAFGTGELTWEWALGLRSYAHVLPIAAVMRAMRALGLDTPGAVAAAPRLLHALLSAASDLCVTCRRHYH